MEASVKSEYTLTLSTREYLALRGVALTVARMDDISRDLSFSAVEYFLNSLNDPMRKYKSKGVLEAIKLFTTIASLEVKE